MTKHKQIDEKLTSFKYTIRGYYLINSYFENDLHNKLNNSYDYYYVVNNLFYEER